MRKIEVRVTIDRIVETNKDRLIELSLKESWIKDWLPWVRISDIRWGLDLGIRMVRFRENELISRFLKEGWKG